MRFAPALFLVATAAAVSCTSPPPRDRPPPTPVAPLDAQPDAAPPPGETALADPREAVAPAIPRPVGEGAFLVVRRQSEEPLESNDYITGGGWEMVAELASKDRRAAEAVRETLKLAGLPTLASGGLGREGVYVPHALAERARRLLERLPGASVHATTPAGQAIVLCETPQRGDESNSVELVCGLLRPREGDAERETPPTSSSRSTVAAIRGAQSSPGASSWRGSTSRARRRGTRTAGRRSA